MVLLGGAIAPPSAQAVPLDLTPDVKTVSPTGGAKEVPLDVTVRVDFDRAMVASSINEDSFCMTYLGTIVIGGRPLPFTFTVDAVVKVSADRTYATLNPKSDIQPSRQYTVHLTDEISAMFGSLGPFKLDDTPYTWSFNTITPPEVTARTPAIAATNMPLDQTVTITSDKGLNLSTVSSWGYWTEEEPNSTSVRRQLPAYEARTTV